MYSQKKLGETIFGSMVIGNGILDRGNMYGLKENGKEKEDIINGCQAIGKNKLLKTYVDKLFF